MCDGNTGCQERYNDMDCLPVDEFTLNPGQIQAANYTLRGCLQNRANPSYKSAQPERQQPQVPAERRGSKNREMRPKMNQQLFLPGWAFSLSGGLTYITDGGIETNGKKDLSGVPEGDWDYDDPSESEFTFGLNARFSAILNSKNGLFGVLGLGFETVRSDEITGPDGESVEIYAEGDDIDTDDPIIDRSSPHWNEYLYGVAGVGYHVKGLFNGISPYVGMTYGKRYTTFYSKPLLQGVDDTFWGTSWELGTELHITDKIAAFARINLPTTFIGDEGKVDTQSEGSYYPFNVTPSGSLGVTMYLSR